MPTVLVVDDSPTDRLMAGRFLQQEPDVTVDFASDGNEALDRIRARTPDVVVADLQMPNCNGLQLVDRVRDEFPRLPIILMTSKGSEEIAAEALRKGAASYVPKRVLAAQLRDIVARVLSTANADALQSRLMHSLATCHFRFELQDDVELVETLTTQIQGMLRCLPLGDESERLRVVLAVKHALLNALYHGNLEIPLNVDDLRFTPTAKLVQERMMTSPYADRLLILESRISRDEAVFEIQHAGPGFPCESILPESLDPCSTSHYTRGVVLISSVMDEMYLSDDGCTVTLTKRASKQSEVIIDLN